MLGSANISGSRAMHLMSGNLSHQIEHHLFPDLPSRRYHEIAPRVREVFHRYEPELPRGSAGQAGRQRLAQGGAAVPAQRLAAGDHAQERPGADRQAVPQRGAAGARPPRLHPASLAASSLTRIQAPDSGIALAEGR